MNRFVHCGSASAGTPFIAPPTWNKGPYHEQLRNVWKAAAATLAEAENIFVCGYSLPPTDQFFRYLYAMGTMGQRPLRKFCVFDPDERVRDRFVDFLGPGASKRFEFEALKFSQAIDRIREKLDLSKSALPGNT